MKPPHSKEELKKHLASDGVEDIVDTCRIIIIYLLCSVFFIASGDTVNGWMF